MEVTLEDLRRYQDLKRNIASIEAEIQSLYYPVSSPSGSPIISGKSSVRSAGDPTAAAYRDIEKRKEKLKLLQSELQERADKIYAFVDNMDDHHMASILRYHFLIGLTWAQTSEKVYGYVDGDICRNAVKRYFRKKDRFVPAHL